MNNMKIHNRITGMANKTVTVVTDFKMDIFQPSYVVRTGYESHRGAVWAELPDKGYIFKDSTYKNGTSVEAIVYGKPVKLEVIAQAELWAAFRKKHGTDNLENICIPESKADIKNKELDRLWNNPETTPYNWKHEEKFKLSEKSTDDASCTISQDAIWHGRKIKMYVTPYINNGVLFKHGIWQYCSSSSVPLHLAETDSAVSHSSTR